MSKLATTQHSAPIAATIGALSGARVHDDFIVARTSVAAKMRLVTRGEAFEITSAVHKMFANHELPVDPAGISSAGLLGEYNNEIAVRHLAMAVRDPGDVSKPLATLDDWRGCDDEQISAVWERYKEMQDRLDPLLTPERLTDAEILAIRSAVKKKELDLLKAFGCSRLSAFLLTTDAPPAL